MKYTPKRIKRRRAKAWLGGLAALTIAVLSIGTGQSRPPLPRPEITQAPSKIVKDSLDKKTGLILAPGFNVVSVTCVRCHSPKLITEKRATREGWVATIRWMQQNQGLWDLGKDEPLILDYLAKNYAPRSEGRRPPLKITQWYQLK